jgi:dolichol-phosphate hexosyltransferase
VTPAVKLSILTPVYNERATLAAAVKEVPNVDFPCEIELVAVDDGSTDGTRDLYPALADDWTSARRGSAWRPR